MGRLPGAEADAELASFRPVGSALRRVDCERAFTRTEGDATVLAQEVEQIFHVMLVVDLDPDFGKLSFGLEEKTR